MIFVYTNPPDKDNKVRAKNAGAVPTLLATLREFDHDTTVTLCALKALGNLVSLGQSRTYTCLSSDFFLSFFPDALS